MRISNTVFFKHKYVTKSTVTPVDAIIHTYQELMKAINGIMTTRGLPHTETLTKVNDQFQSQHLQTLAVKPKADGQHTRVEFKIRHCW